MQNIDSLLRLSGQALTLFGGSEVGYDNDGEPTLIFEARGDLQV